LGYPQGQCPPMCIEILCKLPNDSLVEAVLILGEDIKCVNPDNYKLLSPEYQYKYTDIAMLVMRARPEHCDIRFNSKKRFRLMSSYLQIITNEIILRAKDLKIEIEVIFEGDKSFDYDHVSISKQPPITRQQAGKFTGFFRKENQINTSDLLVYADEETKLAMKKVDANLDEMANVLGHIEGIANTTTMELDRQSEQIDKISQRADEANAKFKNTNLRIDRVIKSWSDVNEKRKWV